ncbi:hypothetical protein E3N88_18585 [Mikania micrantha]|uniref:Uncharacterized protein n=1 Tax=Mikania micrantha TaxID=192012 RepID=A0A5N6NM91_9ASTR|nr:hypothetical protein E3N88_18585 [Mikania micrantha]
MSSPVTTGHRCPTRRDDSGGSHHLSEPCPRPPSASPPSSATVPPPLARPTATPLLPLRSFRSEPQNKSPISLLLAGSHDCRCLPLSHDRPSHLIREWKRSGNRRRSSGSRLPDNNRYRRRFFALAREPQNPIAAAVVSNHPTHDQSSDLPRRDSSNRTQSRTQQHFSGRNQSRQGSNRNTRNNRSHSHSTVTREPVRMPHPPRPNQFGSYWPPYWAPPPPCPYPTQQGWATPWQPTAAPWHNSSRPSTKSSNSPLAHFTETCQFPSSSNSPPQPAQTAQHHPPTYSRRPKHSTTQDAGQTAPVPAFNTYQNSSTSSQSGPAPVLSTTTEPTPTVQLPTSTHPMQTRSKTEPHKKDLARDVRDKLLLHNDKQVKEKKGRCGVYDCCQQNHGKCRNFGAEMGREGQQGRDQKGQRDRSILLFKGQVVIQDIPTPLPIPVCIWEDISLDFIVGLSSYKCFDTILELIDRLLNSYPGLKSLTAPALTVESSTGTTPFTVVYGLKPPPLNLYVVDDTNNAELEGQLLTKAVFKQFGGGGYGGSDNVVTDEAELKLHQKLEKLYVSTRAAKHFQRDIVRGVEGYIVTGSKQVEIGTKLSEDSRKYGVENTCTSGSTLSRAAKNFSRARAQMEKERGNLLKSFGTQVAEPLRAMVIGAPLEDARHLAQRYDRMRQEAEAQAVEVSKKQARAREGVVNPEMIMKLEAAESKLQDLKSNMAILGREAASAMAAVEAQQQKMTLQRLISMVE